MKFLLYFFIFTSFFILSTNSLTKLGRKKHYKSGNRAFEYEQTYVERLKPIRRNYLPLPALLFLPFHAALTVASPTNGFISQTVAYLCPPLSVVYCDLLVVKCLYKNYNFCSKNAFLFC